MGSIWRSNFHWNTKRGWSLHHRSSLYRREWICRHRDFYDYSKCKQSTSIHSASTLGIHSWADNEHSQCGCMVWYWNSHSSTHLFCYLSKWGSTPYYFDVFQYCHKELWCWYNKSYRRRRSKCDLFSTHDMFRWSQYKNWNFLFNHQRCSLNCKYCRSLDHHSK